MFISWKQKRRTPDVVGESYEEDMNGISLDCALSIISCGSIQISYL
jgi:hypothetical protein